MRTLFLLVLGVALASLTVVGEPANASTAARTGSLVGQVIDQQRQPVAGAVVEVVIETPAGRIYRERTRTDRRGRFSFDPLPAGKGGVRAGARGIGRDRERILIQPGERTRVRLVLH